MPLPPEPFTPSGAYTISSPPENKIIELPHIVICHCNDCRSAVGNLTLAGFCCQIDIVEVSVLKHAPDPRTSLSIEDAEDDLPTIGKVNVPDADPRREWIPARKISPPEHRPLDSFTGVYRSSSKAARTFCKRCGCRLTYTFMGPRDPLMLDVYLGTVDREDLGKYVLRPDRHVWWDHEIKWIKELYKSEAQGGLPKHAITNLKEVVEDRTEMEGDAEGTAWSTNKRIIER